MEIYFRVVERQNTIQRISQELDQQVEELLEQKYAHRTRLVLLHFNHEEEIDPIEENLTKVWGKKMGPDSSNTAITVRWVLASLSDFNGQLQARDIVRFLKFATQESGVPKTQSTDRFILPDDMRQAVKKCSDEKLKEVDGKFYIPESIRYALGYNKSKRGGIKLVSLLVSR